MSWFAAILLVLCAAAAYVATPVALFWGWVRWARRGKQRTLPSILSFAGFVLATTSALVAISAIIYAQTAGFAFYDPQLLKFYRLGLGLSLVAMVFAICGVWRSSPLRWHAAACSAGTLLFWMVATSNE